MNESSPSASAELSTLRAWLLAILMAAVVFGAIAPTLTWPELTGGNENIVVQTALEMRRSGPVFSKNWLVPTMLGEPRVKKPPLVAWMTALAMRPATVAALDDPGQRDAAYRSLAWQIRWTGLLAGCVLMLATFELGRLIGGTSTGLCAAAAVATNLLFLKYARQSTSDVHLAMWVVVANVGFLHGLLRKRWWLAATLGAFATGMAFLCKGPVALLETVLPLAICLSLRLAPKTYAGRTRFIPLGVGAVVFGLVALPWFAYVYLSVPHVWNTWFTEVSRAGATVLRPDSVFTYFQLIPYMWPWLIFGALGLVAARTDRRLLIPLLQILVPLLIMVWVKDRKERYLLPMIAPAAVLCGAGVVAWWRSGRPGFVLAIHGISLVGGAIAFILIGTHLKTVAGKPWYPIRMAIWASVVVLALTGLWWIAQRRRAAAVVAFTAVIMLLQQAFFIFGYSQSESGRSPFKAMANRIRVLGPDVPVYDWLGPQSRVDEGLAVYLDRTIQRLPPEKVIGPAVMIMRESDTRPRPTLPAPWHVLTSAVEKKSTWWAFARE